MSGKEIRRAMWQRAKGRRGFLLLVSLVGFLPSLVQILALRLWHLTLPLWLGGFPAAPVGMLLSLGVSAVALKQTEGNEQKKVSHMFTFFTDGRLGKAILLALALWAVSTVFTAASNLMMAGGETLVTQADRVAGMLAGGLLLNLVGRLLAPLGILFALVALAALFWYMPYFELAHAAFAKELFRPEKKAQKKEKRAMKLKEKDGWCQVGLLTGEKKKGDDS